MINNKNLNLIKPYLEGVEAYLVGGFVRDYFLKKISYDCDIAIKCDNVSEFVKNIADLLRFSHYFREFHGNRVLIRIKYNQNIRRRSRRKNK